MSTHPGTHPGTHAGSQHPSDTVTVIGAGIRVNGRIAGSEDLHVEGYVEGSVELSETLHVAAQGIVVAQVRARDVVISGVVVGNVTAEDSVTLNQGAKLVGDITAPRLIVADGAAFSGNVVTAGDAPARPRARQVAVARPRPVARPAARPAAPAAPSRSSETTAVGHRAPAGGSPIAKRIAAIPPPELAHTDDEATVVVRHAEIDSKRGSDANPEKTTARAGKKKSKKAPPRARVPKPGKRRVNRRG